MPEFSQVQKSSQSTKKQSHLHTSKTILVDTPDRTLTSRNILKLQRMIGNQSVQRLLTGNTAKPAKPFQWLPTAIQLDRYDDASDQLHGVDLNSDLEPAQIMQLQNTLMQAGLLREADMANEQPGTTPQAVTMINMPATVSAYNMFRRMQTLHPNINPPLAAPPTLSDDERQAVMADVDAYAEGLMQDYPQQIQSFIQQPGMSDEEKVRVIGEINAAVARMEFLLGTIYYGGSGENDNWEESSNSGFMVDQYTGGSTNAWCAKFATTVMRNVTGANVVVGSGAKVGWGRGAWNFDADDGGAQSSEAHRSASANENRGNYNPFAALRQTIQQIDDGTITDQTKEEAVQNFYENVLQPQAGDIVVVRRPSSDPNSLSRASQDPDVGNDKSHTMMIEQASGTTFTTIEGNKANRVTGREFDLTDADHLAEIVQINRASLRTYDSDYETPADDAAPAANPITQEDLLQPIQNLNEMLQNIAQANGYLQTGGADAPVSDIVEHQISATTGSST